jgi:signal peptidase I
MKNITYSIVEIRECLRNLWNQHYKHLTEDKSVYRLVPATETTAAYQSISDMEVCRKKCDPFDVVDFYNETCAWIIKGYINLVYGDECKIYIKINPDYEIDHVYIKKVDNTGRYGQWDYFHEYDFIKRNTFLMMDFFDFDNRSYRDLDYITCTTNDDLTDCNKSIYMFRFVYCSFFIIDE